MDYCYRCCAYHCRFSTEIPVYFLYRLRESMHPTFEDRDKVMVSRISKTLNHINSGDVVIFMRQRKMTILNV